MDWSISSYVLTCLSGLTGTQCIESITPIDALLSAGSPVVQSIPYNTNSSGYQHFYFDVPGNTWNDTLIAFSTGSTNTTRLMLRRNAYSNIPLQTTAGLQLVSAYGNYIFDYDNTHNTVDEIAATVIGGSDTLISSPFERFSLKSSTTRWVLTLACPNAGANYADSGINNGCAGTITVSYPKSTIDMFPQPPCAASSAQFSLFLMTIVALIWLATSSL